MARNLRSGLVCLVGALGLLTLAPDGAGAARLEWSQMVSFETPAGAITCGATPLGEPNWAEVLVASTPKRLSGEVLGSSPLRCSTASYGEVLLTGAGFPWHFALNTTSRRAILRGTRTVGLAISLVSLPGAKCLYEASKLTGTLSSETPPVLTLSAPKVTLNKSHSFPLCPAGGSFSGSFTLP